MTLPPANMRVHVTVGIVDDNLTVEGVDVKAIPGCHVRQADLEAFDLDAYLAEVGQRLVARFYGNTVREQ